jgi:hypothetical protein
MRRFLMRSSLPPFAKLGPDRGHGCLLPKFGKQFLLSERCARPFHDLTLGCGGNPMFLIVSHGRFAISQMA